jgi:hypothetical protein
MIMLLWKMVNRKFLNFLKYLIRFSIDTITKEEPLLMVSTKNQINEQ